MDRTPESEASDPARRFLRHCVATLAYRGAKALRGVPDGFAGFTLPGAARNPGEILAHMANLLDWALSMARGKEAWHNSTPGSWDEDAERFFRALHAFDAYLASDATLHAPAERLFQGPIADALTHVGQIATRRRLAGAPVRGENYFRAEIVIGRVGPDQSSPRREFD